MKIRKGLIMLGIAGLLGAASIICISCQEGGVSESDPTPVADSLFGNQYLIDTVRRYDYAIIKLDGTVLAEGVVEKWTDYEDGDQIQVQIEGNTYLVHSSNIVLMKEGQ